MSINIKSNILKYLERTPEEYDDWIAGCGKEATDLEIIRLVQLVAKGKKVFVDTNISVEVLKEIYDYDHVAVMLSPQSMSVERFFDREDEEKKCILAQINHADDSKKALENYRNCLTKVNSREKYEAYENSGFFVIVRDDERTVDEALDILEKHFML